MHYFSKFFKKFNQVSFSFWRLLMKNTIYLKCCEKLSKIFKNLLRKLGKCIILSYFSKQFNKPCVSVLRVWTKRQDVGNFRKVSKDFVRKLRKCIILADFSKDLTNNALIFCAFGQNRKLLGDFWWKFSRKVEFFFYFYFGKFVTKNVAFGNNTIFLQQIFRLGGGDFPLSPSIRPWVTWQTHQWYMHISSEYIFQNLCSYVAFTVYFSPREKGPREICHMAEGPPDGKFPHFSHGKFQSEVIIANI